MEIARKQELEAWDESRQAHFHEAMEFFAQARNCVHAFNTFPVRDFKQNYFLKITPKPVSETAFVEAITEYHKKKWMHRVGERAAYCGACALIATLERAA